MLNLFLVFIIKVFDNILGTTKTILIQQNKSIIAGFIVIISQIIFYKLISAVTTGGDVIMYLISIASGLGTYLALKINNKFSKEKTFVNVILSDNKKEMIKLRNFLKNHKITNLATDGYTKNWKKTIAITAYAETKKDSKLIDDYIANCENKFKRIINVK
ncbi:MAG: hypothetical protein PHF21_04835 [Bacilli bacterium]|nr:hypothetical protein [Bacilli bacterium]